VNVEPVAPNEDGSDIDTGGWEQLMGKNLLLRRGYLAVIIVQIFV